MASYNFSNINSPASIISGSLTDSPNLVATVMPEVLGLCDVCEKLDGVALLSHLENHHPLFYKVIQMTEKVIKIKQQMEEDNKPKTQVYTNRLDSVEE